MADAKDLVAKQMARLARASEPEVDFACGGTDTEPMPSFSNKAEHMGTLNESSFRLLISQMYASWGWNLPESPPDMTAITRSIARGS